MKPVFNPSIIRELQTRIGQYQAKAAPGAPVVKLGQLKVLYKRWFGGRDPHNHALEKIDAHLDKLSSNALEKARRPFDQGRHPRGRRGQFRPSGEQPAGGQRSFYRDVASRDEHRDLADDNAGYQAFQTQVIPETRFSVFGPPIAGAAGLGLGAISGASASLAGNPVDRATTAGARWLGGKIGGLAGNVAGQLAVDRPRRVARSVIGAVNSRMGTTFTRPGPTAGDALVARAITLGQKGGSRAGNAVGRASSLVFAAPAAGARTYIGRAVGGGLRGQILGRLAGAAVGTVIPGAFYASTLHRLQSKIGPYEDTLFPRRVRKLAGPLLDAPEVLAKQAELLADEELAKANLFGVARSAAGFAGRVIGRFRSAVPPIRNAAASVGPRSPAQQAADAAFESHAKHVTVGRMRAARAGVVGSHIGALAAGGAGIGAISGAAYGAFNQKHPRDKQGRFATKAKGAVTGAKIGAVVGAGLGLAAGLAAARRGHTALLTQAIERLRGETTVEGMNVHAAMHTAAEAAARKAHALAFVEANPRVLEEFAPGGQEHQQVIAALRARGIEQWLEREGNAMQGGPRAWYRFQLDRSFDAAAKREVGRLGKIPTLDGRAATNDLLDRVDVEKLDEGQKKIWDNLVKRRDKALGEIDQIYEARTAHAAEINTELTDLTNERTELVKAIRAVPAAWDDLKTQSGLRIAELRAFAKNRMGHTLEATTAKAAVEEIEGRMPIWETEANARLGRIDTRIPELQPFLDEAKNQRFADLSETELRAVRNPFATGARPFFRNRPANIDTREGFNAVKEAEGDRAAKRFVDESKAHADAAEENLNTLIAEREAALQAGMPHTSAGIRAFHYVAPILAPRLHQAAIDYASITTAGRSALTGTQKAVYDWLHANSNPKQAWVTTKSLASKAKAKAKATGGFALRNWKTISSIIGPLTAMGAIDLSQPGVKKKIKINPKTWRTPKDLGVVTEWPDAVRRPDELIFGLSYRDRTGREKFLHGWHIKSKEGAHDSIGFGVDVEAYKGQVRGGGGGSAHTRSEPIAIKDPKAAQQAEEIKKGGHIKLVGPPGFEFQQREGGNADQVQEDARQQLFARHVNGLIPDRARNHSGIPAGQSTHNRKRYFDSLRDIMEASGSENMDEATRVGLLVGANGKRGVFANANNVYRSGDRIKIAQELRRQIHEQGNRLLPLNPKEGPHDEYTQLRRALWLVGHHFGLSAAQNEDIAAHLHAEFKRETGREPPESAAAAAAAAAPPPESTAKPATDQAGFDRYFASVVTPGADNYVPPEMRPDEYQNDEKFRAELHGPYVQSLKNYRRQNINPTDEAAHRHAAQIVNEYINSISDKSEPIGDLAKRLQTPGDLAPQRPRVTRAPSISGAATSQVSGVQPSPQSPQISGAASTPALPKPAQPGAPRLSAPTIGGDLRQAVKPAHALGQLGTYGLSQLGYDVVNNIAQHFVPGGGLIARAARFGAGAAASVGGTFAGAKGGRALGRALGDKTPTPEQGNTEGLVRGIGGSAAQIAFNSFGAPAAERGAIAVGARILGGALGTAADPFIGPLGTALGAAAAGALADEGVGILYRHLSRYGSHVPKMAAAQLGHKGGPPSALAVPGAA